LLVYRLSPQTLTILDKHNIALDEGQKQAVKELLLKQASDESFVKHFMKQQGIAGHSEDIVRILSDYSWHAENRLARLTMEPRFYAIDNSIKDMEKHEKTKVPTKVVVPHAR